MIYTPMTNKAIKLMYVAHKDQVDKSGLPYVFHPWHVAESMKDEVRCTVALLHDVIEDTNITLDMLKEEGFSEEVIEAVDVLTHKSDMDYGEYIRNIMTNDIAVDVKIADLRHNMDETRGLGSSQIPSVKLNLYRASLDSLLNYRTEKVREKLIK